MIQVKSFLTIFWLFLLSVDSYCQVWVDSGAVWHYDYRNWDRFGFDRYEYRTDTLVEDKLCQKIIGKRFTFVRNANNIVVQSITSELTTQVTYVSGDTVFYRNNNQFFVLFNFGALPGERWVISTHNPYGECQDTSFLQVQQIGIVFIHSMPYRFIKVAPTPNSPIGLTGTIVERFGLIDSLLRPFHYLFPSIIHCDSMLSIVEWDYLGFKCFRDNSFPLFNPKNNDCEYFLNNVFVEDYNHSNLQLFPNPTTGKLYFGPMVDQVSRIDVFNFQGQLLNKTVVSNLISDIDISDYSPGLYLFLITEKNGKQFLSKIVKN